MGLCKEPIKGYKDPCKLIFDKVKKGSGQIQAAMLQGYGWVTWRFPLRGGNYNNTSSAGLGALNLNTLRANLNNNVGFRPALPPSQMSGLYGGLSSAEGKRSHIPSPVYGENMNRHGRLVGPHFSMRGRIPSMPLFCGAPWLLP
jgi:hypothetical protein